MRIKHSLVALVVCVFLAAISHSQIEEHFDFYARGDYRPNVPRPQSVLRYDVGDHHTTYAQMEQVINAIATAAPDRMKIFDIGETNEHRMMHHIAISSPENMQRLDEIRANNLRLADPRNTTAAQAQAIAQNNPAIAWMAYTIHGNESSSFEAMMQVVYQLAASNEPTTLDILKNCVVLVVTGENPDGHERFVTWYNSVATGDPNRNALEHREPWSIWGRYSHYRFDLNRDALPQSQKETQNLQAAFRQWMPQLSIDHHGQPSQFFFPPDSLPINPNLPQPAFGKWNERYGRANSAAFDTNHWDYYVRDIFDAFYPGYWDMYPSLNGAIGMTYETDGGGFKGLRWTREDGSIVTLRSAIAKHYVAGLAALDVTAKNRAERLKDFYDFRSNGMRDAGSSWKIKRVVILPDKDPTKAAELIEVLQRSGIEVRTASASFSSSRAHSYLEKNAPAATRSFPAGAYVIDLNQPQAVLIKSILEQDTPQDKAFVDDNMARFRRNQMRGSGQAKEDYGFYDITAWSLPLAFGVDAFWTEDAGPVNGSAVTADTIAAAKRGSYPGRASVAYIIPYETDSAAVGMIRLLQQGYRVAVTTKPLNAAGRNWPRGTFVIRVSRNPATMHDALSKLAGELGFRVIAANSGYAEEGDTGIGGESVNSMRQPKIAIVADDAVDQTSYGSIWWTLDRYGIPFTALSISAIKNGALRDFNVLIMPDGSAGRYMSLFGTGGVTTLKNFANSGGTIITVRGASVFAALKDVGFTTSRLVGSEADEDKGKDEEKKSEPSPTPSPGAKATPSNQPVEQPTDFTEGIAPSLPPIASPSADANKVPVPLPGSIMRATVDRTTYLTYGIEQNELPVLLASGYFFRYSKEGNNALVFDANPRKPLTISGFTWDGNTERLLSGTAYIIDEPMGSGHVILFAEEPFFRGLFRSTTRPFMNSILFNGVF